MYGQLLSGTAEIFGTELALHQPYTFTGTKAAVYTYHGCRLEVKGTPQSDYVAEETPMASYANVHFALENLRNDAAASQSIGPRVMVLGPENAGKSSLVKILSAYANRTGGQPIVLNLDPKEGMLSIPGTISAFALESIIDVEQGWGSSPTNGPSQIPVKLPLVYHYGCKDPEAKSEIYKAVVTRLGLSVMNRLEDDAMVKFTGCVIDTPGSISQGKNGYDIVQHIVAELQGMVMYQSAE
jgi:polyribonucleotide 5'-hydroxyl-kinase